MNRPKLTYFDAPVSRGEECRLALHCAGVDFEDERIKGQDWPALKPKTPFGSLPMFTLPGYPVFAQTNAILVLIGRRHGLHPKDDFEAARHEATMHYVEELRANVSPTMRIADEAEKRRARVELATNFLPNWARNAEAQIAQGSGVGDGSAAGPFFGGAQLQVVDLKLYVVVKWIASGSLDHIPKDLFAGYPHLNRIHDAVAADPRVRAWYAR